MQCHLVLPLLQCAAASACPPARPGRPNLVPAFLNWGQEEVLAAPLQSLCRTHAHLPCPLPLLRWHDWGVILSECYPHILFWKESSWLPSLQVFTIPSMTTFLLTIRQCVLKGTSSLLTPQVFTIPSMIGLVLGAGAGVASFDTLLLFKNLVLTVLLPLLAGAAAQVVIPGVCAGGAAREQAWGAARLQRAARAGSWALQAGPP